MVGNSESGCIGSTCMPGASIQLLLWANVCDKVREHVFKKISRNHQCFPSNIWNLIYGCLKMCVLDPVLCLCGF